MSRRCVVFIYIAVLVIAQGCADAGTEAGCEDCVSGEQDVEFEHRNGEESVESEENDVPDEVVDDEDNEYEQHCPNTDECLCKVSEWRTIIASMNMDEAGVVVIELDDDEDYEAIVDVPGLIQFPSGIYAGEIESDLMHGPGAFTADDWCYIGTWNKGEPEQGMYVCRVCGQYLIDRSVNDLSVDRVKMEYEFGNVCGTYTGSVTDGYPDGRGRWTSTDGHCEIAGLWSEDSIVGKRICTYIDEISSESFVRQTLVSYGEWLDHNRTGAGYDAETIANVLITSEHEVVMKETVHVYYGLFADDMRWGPGMIISSSQVLCFQPHSLQAGVFERNELIYGYLYRFHDTGLCGHIELYRYEDGLATELIGCDLCH